MVTGERGHSGLRVLCLVVVDHVREAGDAIIRLQALVVDIALEMINR